MTTGDEIVDATFTALYEHGYADLTMEAIGEEFDKSTSLIHYHFDSKADLLATCLETIHDEFLEDLEHDPETDPEQRLLRLAELVVGGTGDDGVDEFHTALLELRAQAPYDEALREQLARNDAVWREHIADIVRDGIEQGVFREVDPEHFAALFRSAIEGAQSHNVILGEDAPSEDAMAGIEELLVHELLVESERTEGADA
ncbi:transcriptional regulator, TetR family [Natronoarchaeum philippinense]|uniref:Transcriptional regulator, TetR family n=1 Tax=Natronoarchaeum philippinense TaxID=558529 RepID=A0A285P934_NATPI|nr:TetR/AcrR family transcriptional regulator [Natronoarchaeum philippinense]SNZ17747.1 transcriptional regulator, TetR family [Natronoarchaeum philippinense]